MQASVVHDDQSPYNVVIREFILIAAYDHDRKRAMPQPTLNRPVISPLSWANNIVSI
jgi:hypothetical protein